MKVNQNSRFRHRMIQQIGIFALLLTIFATGWVVWQVSAQAGRSARMLESGVKDFSR